jgi:hypothetical protein
LACAAAGDEVASMVAPEPQRIVAVNIVEVRTLRRIDMVFLQVVQAGLFRPYFLGRTGLRFFVGARPRVFYYFLDGFRLMRGAIASFAYSEANRGFMAAT